MRFSLSIPLGVCVAWLLVFLAFPGSAQTVNTTQFTVARTGNGGLSSQLFPTAGGWLTAGQIRFSNDSNCITIARFSPALTLTRSRQYKLPGARAFTNYGPFANLSSGLIFRGQGSSADCIFSVDSAFALRWGVQILPNIGMSILVSHGPDRIVGYPIASVPSGNTGFTRVWGTASTGTGWRGRRLSSTRSGWRITSACAPDNTGIHYLSGDTGAPLIKLDTTKVYWGYLLDAGGTQTRVGRPLAAANGNLWVPMSTIPATNQPSTAIICRYDTAGTLLWSRQVAMASRYLAFSDLYEMPGGDLLISGYMRIGPGGKFQPMLFRFTANGTLVWAHHWDLGTRGPVGGVPSIVPLPGGQFRMFNSDVSFIDLDANFNGCQFVDQTANIVVSTPTITATPLPLTMTTIAITTAPQGLINRTFTYTRSLVCSALGMAEEAAAETTVLAAWPQPLPRGTTLQLALPTGWRAADTYLTLTSAVGQLVWRGPWADEVRLPSSLPAGCWTLTATGRAGQVIHRRVLTE
jgi:hypothetical protein